MVIKITQPLRLDAAQGVSEERTEAYMEYVEGVPQLATKCCAKNTSGAASYAGRQAGVARGLGVA